MAEYAEFQHEYDGFLPKGSVQVSMTFPVENEKGVRGLSSLAEGETTLVKFLVKNIGSAPLGADVISPRTRRLGVQFYFHKGDEYNVKSRHVTFKTEDGQVMNIVYDEKSDNDVYRGNYVDIPYLEEDQTIEIVRKLRLSRKTKAYSRLAIEAEILLEDLPVGSSPRPFSVIQRRKLDIVCEPAYHQIPGAEVVLVVSTSTKRDVYITLVEAVLRSKFGFIVEIFPLSRYGTLGPSFRPGASSDTLKELFKNKLVILFNRAFKPVSITGTDGTSVCPSQLLPGGCLVETSGFDPSTRWLVLDVDTKSEDELLHVFSAQAKADVETMEHESPTNFIKFFNGMLNEEQKSVSRKSTQAMVRFDTIKVNSWRCIRPGRIAFERRIQTMQRKANSVQKWLTKKDPLRQYIVEYVPMFVPEGQLDIAKKIGKCVGIIRVLRGSFRPDNSTVVVRETTFDSHEFLSPQGISSRVILFSIALALPANLRVKAFCHALTLPSNEGPILMALRDSFVSQILFDVANILDGNPRSIAKSTGGLQAKRKLLLPTLNALTNSQSMKKFLLAAKQDRKIGKCTRIEMSKFIAQLECIATSRDLRPIWLPFSIKHKVRPLLAKMVCELRNEWRPVIDDAIAKKTLKDLNKAVLTHIRKDRKKFRVKTKQRWRKALNYLHSTHNEEKYSSCLQVSRLLECHGSRPVERASMRVKKPDKTIMTGRDCTELRNSYIEVRSCAAHVRHSINAGRRELLVTECIDIVINRKRFLVLFDPKKYSVVIKPTVGYPVANQSFFSSLLLLLLRSASSSSIVIATTDNLRFPS
jgi:hypothetical protein